MGCDLFLFLAFMFSIDSGIGVSCLGFSILPQGHLHIDARRRLFWLNLTLSLPLSIYVCVCVCPCAVRAHQSGGSEDQGLQEEMEELGVQGWRGDCRSLPEIVGCAVFDVLY